MFWRYYGYKLDIKFISKQTHLACSLSVCLSLSHYLSVCRLFVLSTHAYRHAFTATHAHTLTPHTHEQRSERDKGRERVEIESEKFKYTKAKPLFIVCTRYDKRKRTERETSPSACSSPRGNISGSAARSLLSLVCMLLSGRVERQKSAACGLWIWFQSLIFHAL